VAALTTKSKASMQIEDDLVLIFKNLVLATPSAETPLAVARA
jgi:hypothetical protein